ncbi:hypothetical protein PACID_23960 [Acidipropionibacterium acidipropionici ATCC 4875]|uniref:Uncharacterized protein n=1 Tax=Acidipropionibacterium acidipropionici (strain ATCC 4875 / DSM 20272 / JCM 6432 / NBRC 12425 / NCIMB 8070 / 4) TaxID=1171373 RepID=K7S6B2_ACIA4|nr:hypothetical protein PACID_23960 [Acidipropionibacterium acidipropionici ATCC 4875]
MARVLGSGVPSARLLTAHRSTIPRRPGGPQPTPSTARIGISLRAEPRARTGGARSA